MRSMTGYGRGESAQKGFKITIEVSSVNRKQTEISVALPREFEVLEAQVRDEINRRVSRGRITVRINMHTADTRKAVRVQLNLALAKAYAKELHKLARELRLPDAVTLEHLVRAPGILQIEAVVTDAAAFWPSVRKALDQSLASLIKMREREGAHLAKDLAARMKIIRAGWTRIQKHAPAMQQRYRDQLIERIKQAGLPTPELDDERLIKEVVYFAERSDITEELTRLRSHFGQFDDCLRSKEPVGRTLDFLAQEMNREVNTIGAKSNDHLISSDVVVLKAELERFREQAQNVE